MASLWDCEQCAYNSWHKRKLILGYNKRRQMLQTDPLNVAAGWCGRRDRMCWGEARAFVATQPTGPEPWTLTLHPGGQTKLWVTSETRHSVGRECLDRTQITPLTLQKRFTAFYFARAKISKPRSRADLSEIIKQLEVCAELRLVYSPASPSCMKISKKCSIINDS